MGMRRARNAVMALLLAWVTALLVASCLQGGGDDTNDGNDTDPPPATPAPQPAPGTFVLSALWFATDQGVYRLVPGDGEVALLAAGAVVDAIDIDVRRNRLFLHHPDALRQYILDSDLEAIEERTLPDTPAAHWLLEPTTGEPWQVQGSQLAQIQNLEISYAGGFDLGAPVLAAVAGNAGVPFWLLTSEAVHGIDTQGNVLTTLTLPVPAEQLSLRFDPVADKLWLLAPGQVHRHAGNGEPEAGFSVPASTLFDGDGRSGLWLAHDDRLRHLQADGSIGYDLELAQIGHAGPIDALAADPRDASVWIGIDGWLLHLDPSGNLLHQQALPSQSTVHALGLYADTWPPTLAIVEPPDQSHLDTSAVPLLVIYDDPGRGIDPDTLSFERDGTPHPAACSHSGNLAQCLVDLPEGSHRLTARIADRAGNASPDVSVDVTVDTTPPAIPNLALIEIGDPAGGIVSIIGKAGSVEAGTRVQVTNDRSGERVTVQADSLGRFQLTIGAREGDVLHIRATDAAGNTGAPASFTVTSEASGGNDGAGGGGGGGTGGGGNDGGSNDGVGSDPGDDDPPPTDDADSGGGTVPYAVEIDHPTSGAIVPPFVSVTGRHAGPANTGIVVNGKAALVDQDGRFIANDVDVPDSGLIHVVARTFEGETVTVEVRTQPTATPPSFAIIADADGGVAPFTTGFRLISPANVEIAEATIDFDGDGVADDDLFDLEDIFEYTFEQPGIHRVSMTIRMASGDTHHVDTAILVVDPVRLDTMLRELWDEMNQALIDGDTARALEFVSYRSRARYEPIFGALKEHFADIVASYSEPITVTLSPGMAEYAINRIIDGEDYIFLIYLMKDAWGVWRVTEM